MDYGCADYFFDLNAAYFTKFQPPDMLNNLPAQMIQVSNQRNVLLDSLHAIDDTELDFTMEFVDVNFGRLQILKTREFFLIQAHCPFSVDQGLTQNDDYVFPDNQLLLKT